LQSIFLALLTGHTSFTTFKSLPALALYVTVFAFFEKVRKEQFVIGYTNAKTKRFTMQLLNQLP
jgi:transcriptional regulator with PAS, ATPase and Fis domain